MMKRFLESFQDGDIDSDLSPEMDTRRSKKPCPSEAFPFYREKSELDYEVRILIPYGPAGAIIGRRGAMITRLRNQCPGVYIRVPDTTTPERLVDIWSESKIHVLGIVNDVLELLHHDLASRGAFAGDVYEARLLCTQDQMAAITIAESGNWLHGLGNTTGVRFKVYPILAPKSTDRVLSLMGPIPAIVQAVGLILNHTFEENRSNFPIRNEPYDPRNWDGTLCQDYGGYRSGEVGTDLVNAPPAASPYPSPPPQEMTNEGQGPGMTTQTQFTIPESYIGAIIGLKGEVIWNIRRESGAAVSISNPVSDSDERIITISGTQPQVELATTLLQNCALQEHAIKERRRQGSTAN